MNDPEIEKVARGYNSHTVKPKPRLPEDQWPSSIQISHKCTEHLLAAIRLGRPIDSDTLVRNWVTSCPKFTVTTYSLSTKGFHPITSNSSITTEVHRDLSPIQIFQTPTAHWKPRKGKILGLPFHCQCTQFCFISFSTGTPWNRIFFVGQIRSWPSMTGKQAFDGHWSLQIWSLPASLVSYI